MVCRYRRYIILYDLGLFDLLFNAFADMIVNFLNLQELRILILGLDGAGKTTILYRLQVCLLVCLFICLLVCLLVCLFGSQAGDD